MRGGSGAWSPTAIGRCAREGVLRASKFTTGAFIAAAAISASVSARQQTAEVADGKQKYDVYCATCHGPEGKGDGTLSKSLRKKPADLTQLAKKNNGQFPADTVAKPVWGDVFSKSQTSSSPEEVKARIDALVKYIETLQQKR